MKGDEPDVLVHLLYAHLLSANTLLRLTWRFRKQIRPQVVMVTV